MKLATKVGNVYLVGNAARFVINTKVIANIEVLISSISTPVIATKRTVIGVSTQPCKVNIIPVQSNRFFSWLMHQAKNALKAEMDFERVWLNEWSRVAVACIVAVFMV